MRPQGLFDAPRAAGAVEIVLPWPPSANHYLKQSTLLPSGQEMESNFNGDWKAFWKWLRGKVRVMSFPTDEAKEYHAKVHACVIKANARKYFTSRLRITVDVWPPDRRRRDSSNLLKMLEDALVESKVMADDSQLKEHIVRFHDDVVQFGRVEVRIEELL